MRRKIHEYSGLHFCYGGGYICNPYDTIYFFNKKIKSKFVKSFLKYIPYTVLSAMTIPAIFYSTGNITTAVAGTAVAVVLAFFDLPLIIVALSASLAAFIMGLLI